jgi:DUF971 family protein
MAGSGARPVQIELDRARELRICWEDGEVSVYPLSLLRRGCPCAACRTEREATTGTRLPTVPPPEVQRRMAVAEKVELVGNYALRALRITWQDGHAAGIYDYAFLRSLPGGNQSPACPRCRGTGEREAGPRRTEQ